MCKPTRRTEPQSTASQTPAPQLLRYRTWYDAGEGCYVAEYDLDLPGEALEAGCLAQVKATTTEGLTQAAVRNRQRITTWVAGQRAAEASDRP
jgi:hypothetical protein